MIDYLLPAFSWEIFSSYFFRNFGASMVLPLGFTVNGISKRVFISLVLSLLWGSIFGFGGEDHTYMLVDFLLGFSLAFSVFLPMYAVLVLAELNESMRAMNYASIFNPESFSGSSGYISGLQIAVFAVLLNAGFLDHLLVQLGGSFVDFDSFDRGRDWLELGTVFGEHVLKALSMGFQLALVPAILYLLIQFSFMWIGKIWPQSSFYSEMFLGKLLVLFLLISLYHETIPSF